MHTVLEAPAAIDVPGSVEIPCCETKYLGCLWDGNTFRKLAISCKTDLAVNEVTSVIIQWVDADNNPISYGEDVVLKCGEITEHVPVNNGKGTTTFESAEPGEFELVAMSPQGIIASARVVVL